MASMSLSLCSGGLGKSRTTNHSGPSAKCIWPLIHYQLRTRAAEIRTMTKTLAPVLFRLFPMRNGVPNGSPNRTRVWDVLILPQTVWFLYAYT